MQGSSSSANPSSPTDPHHASIASPTKDINLISNYTDAEARLIMNWHVQAKSRYVKGHSVQATKYRWWDVHICLVTIVIYLVAATMAMGTERVKDGEVFRYFLCILSVFGTIFSFVLANTMFWQRYEQHKKSFGSYSVFAMDAEASLARNTIGDKLFRAQRSLDVLYERWKDLTGPSYDIPDYADPVPQAPPKTAENVLRRWQLFAERERFRNEYAAKAYEGYYSKWRIVWMVVVALSAASSLGTFLPSNTDWPIAFAYISLLFNIFAVIVVSVINIQKFSSLSIQHQNAASKCRALNDRAGKLLATRPKSGITQQDLMLEALDILQPMITAAVACTPPIPEYLEDQIDAKFPPSPVHYATLSGLQVPGKEDIIRDTPKKAISPPSEHEAQSPGVPPSSP